MASFLRMLLEKASVNLHMYHNFYSQMRADIEHICIWMTHVTTVMSVGSQLCVSHVGARRVREGWHQRPVGEQTALSGKLTWNQCYPSSMKIWMHLKIHQISLTPPLCFSECIFDTVYHNRSLGKSLRPNIIQHQSQFLIYFFSVQVLEKWV